MSLEFNNYETDRSDLANPTSIHGKFFVAHNEVLELLRCLQRSACEVRQDQINEVNETLRDLDYQSDGFVDRASEVFLEQASELEDFDMQLEP
jgi:predicted nucleic-acid-binding protein